VDDVKHPLGTHSNPEHKDKDTDGDGIPDHHDFCPAQSRGLSGRATDFDGDGCMDQEDDDKDNDGISDVLDKCPQTPQQYRFISDGISDFDGDGCADGIEDSDDDGDTIPNSIDGCPKTAPGEVSEDGTGCSQRQLDERARLDSIAAAAHANHRAHGRAAPSEADPVNIPTVVVPHWQELVQLIRSAWLEVLVGAVLTSCLGQATSFMMSIQQRIPSSPKASVRLVAQKGYGIMSNDNGAWRLAIRVAGYLIFFCLVYLYRARRQEHEIQ